MILEQAFATEVPTGWNECQDGKKELRSASPYGVQRCYGQTVPPRGNLPPPNEPFQRSSPPLSGPL
jgi:hypothetical protein